MYDMMPMPFARAEAAGAMEPMAARMPNRAPIKKRRNGAQAVEEEANNP